jgi:hypothetical protein
MLVGGRDPLSGLQLQLVAQRIGKDRADQAARMLLKELERLLLDLLLVRWILRADLDDAELGQRVIVLRRRQQL